MKQFSQLILLSSLAITTTGTAGVSQASQEAAPNASRLGALSESTAIDVPARSSQSVSDAVGASRANRSPAVEPRVYVEQDGALYYYDYPNQRSHAEQKPPAKL